MAECTRDECKDVQDFNDLCETCQIEFDRWIESTEPVGLFELDWWVEEQERESLDNNYISPDFDRWTLEEDDDIE